MLFHTWPFLVFFTIFYLVYLLARDTRWRIPWLLTASYVFYGWWNPLYLFLIAYSSALDYGVVRAMDGSRHRKAWVGISMANNLFLLGFFKYGKFVTENLNGLLEATGLAWRIPVPGVLLPVGISFFVFQSMSYTLDFYRGQVEKETSFLRFATFVSLFPQLVAGPIERASALLPQLRRVPQIRRENLADGLSLFVAGLFKKLALADYLAACVDPVYSAPEMYGRSTLLLATFAFGWQIYFDFSGYTDMARGVARMMGYNLMLNFKRPYVADSLSDFWGRWHISLSTWFRDYVYIPLGGNRRGAARTYWNLLVTLLLSGLWHGAAWSFVIWGALHAFGVMATRELSRTAFYRNRVPRLIKQLGVCAFVMLTWLFFRAANLEQARLILNRILQTGWEKPEFPLLAVFFCLVIWLYHFLLESRAARILKSVPVRVVLMTAIVLYLLVFASGGQEAFIYFQF
ncbi:MAG: MBOAT family O-acyltransferase [Kiritimatiellia bacterium]|nr:MBOAT family O-acyltransferase [Kiritimatiellia bacterium]